MFNFSENPGISDSCTAYHHPIHAKFHAPCGCFLWRIDVADTKNGDFYARIFLDLAYQRPVYNTLIHLRTKTTKKKQNKKTNNQQTNNNHENKQKIIVPAKARFYSLRQVG